MSLQGVVNKTGILMLLCLGAGAFAWTHPAIALPLMIVGFIGGTIACLVGMFKPETTASAPLYALFEGLALGCISRMFEVRYPGLVLNAMLLTFGVLGLMLMLYTTRTIRVTDPDGPGSPRGHGRRRPGLFCGYHAGHVRGASAFHP